MYIYIYMCVYVYIYIYIYTYIFVYMIDHVAYSMHAFVHTVHRILYTAQCT